MFQHIKLKALVDQPHLLHVSSVGEGVDQVSHAPAIIGRLAVRSVSTACEALFPYMIPLSPGKTLMETHPYPIFHDETQKSWNAMVKFCCHVDFAEVRPLSSTSVVQVTVPGMSQQFGASIPLT